MLSKHSKVRNLPTRHDGFTDCFTVIARNALAQEESDEYNGDYSDPINVHIENDRDGCAC
jgi:hypothetical protein